MGRPEAADVMTDGVIAIEQNASVKAASRKMKEEGIRSLVVTDDGEAVGIVVARDIAYKVAAGGNDPREVTISDVMTEDIITASEHDDVSTIAQAMLEHDVSRIPVLRGQTVVGIVTKTDILRAWPGYVDLLEERARGYDSYDV